MISARTVTTTVAATVLGGGLAAAPAGSAAAAPHVCAGVPGCVRYSFADVDGDGVGDQTGLVVHGGGRWTVLERTARGAVSRYEMTGVDWGGRRSVQAADIDGVPGKELVVSETAGAHSMGFRVLTWRSGHLVRLGEPVQSAWDARDPSLWHVDGAANEGTGIARTMAGSTPRIHVIDGRRLRPGQMTKHVSTYAWTGRGWTRLAQSTSTVPDAVVQAESGWHVPGLRRWG